MTEHVCVHTPVLSSLLIINMCIINVYARASLVAQSVKNLPARQETRV